MADETDESAKLSEVRLADVDDTSKLTHAGTFPGIYVSLTIPTGYFVERVNCEGAGMVHLVLRKRFSK